jgi:lactoylglutathione lyase
MSRSFPWQLEVCGLVLVGILVLVAGRVRAVDEKHEIPPVKFAQTTIDIGCFVTDVDAAAKFYTEALGFREVAPFSVDGAFAKATGLTDGQPLNNIRVFVLGDGDNVTKLKLSSLPNHKAQAGVTGPIPAQYGFRYITIHVADQTATLARLQRAGIKPLGEGAVALPKNLSDSLYLTCVRDPDGNLIELVGPKK